MTKIFNTEDLKELDRNFRKNLINSFNGFKSAFLVGSCDIQGNTNLAIFSNIFHVGANPPYIGMLVRPHSVPRHTLENILQINHYTINHIHKSFYEKAHLTTANFDRDCSEFTVAGLTPEYGNVVKAPYVKESSIKAGLQLVEKKEIAVNNTILLIGEVQEFIIKDKKYIEQDGFIDHIEAESVASIGLDAYAEGKKLERLPYPNKEKLTAKLKLGENGSKA